MAGQLRLTVRMYCMGLGDCFLLTFARTRGVITKKFHMLIDCGMYQGSPNFSERVAKVVNNIKDTTRGKIDLLVITHEHYDHVSGFSSDGGLAQVHQIWANKEIAIKELWMAWTEGTGDEAVKLQDQRHSAAATLHDILRDHQDPTIRAAAEAANGDSAGDAGRRPLAELLGELLGFAGAFAADDTDLSASAEAMEFVKGLAETKNFWYPGKEPITIPGLDGVRFYILGPPSDSNLLYSDPRRNEAYDVEKHISLDQAFYDATLKLRASKRARELARQAARDGLQNDVVLAAGDDKEHSKDNGERDPFEDYPFNHKLGIPILEEPPDTTLGQIAGEGQDEAALRLLDAFSAAYFGPEHAWRRIDEDWQEAVADLALALDEDTNNTSLALAIELVESGEVLIFPGDAQAGNWRAWESYRWIIREANGHERTVCVDDLLRRTVLYKVGHHGSHNATRRQPGLEQMGDNPAGLIALIPTDEPFARNKGKAGWAMPFGPLYKRLLEKTGGRIIRADEGPLARENGGLRLSAEQRKHMMADLKLTHDSEIDTILKAITISDADWKRFTSRTRSGPDPQQPLYYEIDILV
jgi:hypothetical protein